MNMKQVRNLIRQLKRKFFTPSVYGIVIEDLIERGHYLKVVVAFSLDEAIGEAKKYHCRRRGFLDPSRLRVILWDILSAEVLEEELYGAPHVEKKGEIPLELEVVSSEQHKRNVLMEEIIKKKDKALFEKNRQMFSDHEAKYIQAKLK